MTDESPQGLLQEPSEPQAAETLPGPGALIRAARERLNLSLEELAAQTKLARHTLDALERDDFKQLLEPVYVRGYYRKCAKVLNLAEATLVDAYERRVAPRGPALPSKLRLASGTELGSGSHLSLSMAMLFALVAVVVCAFIWRAMNAPPEVPPQISARSAPAPLSAETSPESLPAAAVMVDEATLAAAGTETVLAPAAPAQTTPPASDTPVPAPTTPAAMPPAALAPAQTSAPTPAPASPAAPTSELTLRFSTACWTRIEDSAGQTLINGLINEGATQVLRGTPPFVVFLGNAPGVTLEYEGKTLDIARYVSSNSTARFTVPFKP